MATPNAPEHLGPWPASPSPGQACLLLGQTSPAVRKLLEGRMRLAGWSEVDGEPAVWTASYEYFAELEPRIDELTHGLTVDDLAGVRAAVVGPSVSHSSIIREAVHGVEHIFELRGRARAHWLTELLETPDRLESHCQPVLDIRVGNIVGYEMLIRATSPGLPDITGARLMRAARDSRMLQPFDLICRDLAIRTAKERLPIDTGVFINFLPGGLLAAEAALDQTVQDCARVGIEPKRLVFELIETESFGHTGYLREILSEYGRRGFRIALDDFGAGYSSLNYLMDLEPDYVKLDQELIRGSAGNPHRRSLLSRLIDAAHELGTLVIAEGVENISDFHAVRELGADLAQGYLFAPPAPKPVSASPHGYLHDVLVRHGVLAGSGSLFQLD